jgi:hypothetical protein
MPAAITPTGSRTAYFAVGIQYGSLSEVAAARLQISAAAGVVVHVSSTASNPDTVFLDGATYDLN